MPLCRRRFVTFNVCGINNLRKYEPWKSLGGLREMFDFLEADVICFQETKLQSKDLVKEHAVVPGFQSFFSFSKEKKGYSGVAIYVRDGITVLQAEEGLTGWLTCGTGTYRDQSPSIGGYPNVSRGIGVEIDCEGRVIVLDLGDVVVFGAYCPANSSGDRTEYREDFFKLLDDRIRTLSQMGRKIVLMGDINVCRDLIDSAELLVKSRGTKPEELDSWVSSVPRHIINGLILDSDVKLVDLIRERYPNERGIYTHWNQMLNARPSNYGNRLDYILASHGIECTDANIIPELLGSDHCPVYADLLLADVEPGPTPYLGLKSQLRFKTADLNAHFKSSSDRNLSPSPPVQVKKSKSGQQSITSFFGQPAKVSKMSVKKEAKAVVTIPTYNNISSDNQEKWRLIFKREVPQCLHKEDCKLLVSKKPGVNKGRAFWVCQRAHGEPNDPQARCNFFKWSSS